MNPEQNKTDVFEMILDTNEADQAVVQATPSQIQLPSDWHEEHNEGQLAVDVAQNEEEIIVISTMAGAVTEQIEVYVHNDLLTIRGMRLPPVDSRGEVDYFYQECFWGKFSRTIVLPVDVKGELARADYKNGILTISIPKKQSGAKIPVTIVEE